MLGGLQIMFVKALISSGGNDCQCINIYEARDYKGLKFPGNPIQTLKVILAMELSFRAQRSMSFLPFRDLQM